jgi:hypothetical protein
MMLGKEAFYMVDRGGGIYSDLTDFFNEVKCPKCNSLFKVAPVWEFVLRKGWSACGNCWQIFSLKPDVKLETFIINSDNLETVSDDLEAANASQYIWDADKLENSRPVAVDFFISLGLTAFFDGLERSYPVLRTEDFEMAWKYLSQAGALAVDNLDTRLIADAFEKVEKYKPSDWKGESP